MKVFVAAIQDPSDGCENAPEVCIASSEAQLLEKVKPKVARYCDCSDARSLDDINEMLYDKAETDGDQPVVVFNYEEEV